MSRYDWKQLIKLWETEAVTVEQVIGQLLLGVQEAMQAQAEQAKTVAELHQQVVALREGVARLEGSSPQT